MAGFLNTDVLIAYSAGKGNRRTARLLNSFRWAASATALFFAYSIATEWSLGALGAAGIAFCALLPAYLWCSGRVPGVPLFPVFAATYVWTYAYPLVSGHPIVMQYSDQAALNASLTVCASLLVGTAFWLLALKSSYRPRRSIRIIAAGKGDYLFSLVILAASVFTMGVVGQWLDIEAGVFSILRAVLLGLSSVGAFALAYRWGRGELSGEKKWVFIAALMLYVIAQLTTLFLVSGIVITVLVIVAYAAGSGRVPWAHALALLALFATLHAGKGEMRERYWYPVPQPIQALDYPSFFSEWIGEGLAALADPSDDYSQPLYERVSLVHLLLKVEDESPDEVPYLRGATYSIIPELLIPRIIFPGKPSAHEGTIRLNIHYGIQTRGQTYTTTIGWGLLNEAIANFGLVGILLFGAVTGSVYGWVTKITANVPILSLRMLVAITFMVFAVQTEFTAGVYVSALFQSLVSVFALSFLFMDRKRFKVMPAAIP